VENCSCFWTFKNKNNTKPDVVSGVLNTLKYVYGRDSASDVNKARPLKAKTKAKAKAIP